MHIHKTKLRVQYSETDKMGVVYHGNYIQYFEVGRVELLRSLGLSYKQLEEMGYSLPVVNYNIDYKKPAFYDDELTIETTILQVPSVKIVFSYKTYNSDGDLLNTAETTLVFVDMKTGKPCQSPKILIDKLQNIRTS